MFWCQIWLWFFFPKTGATGYLHLGFCFWTPNWILNPKLSIKFRTLMFPITEIIAKCATGPELILGSGHCRIPQVLISASGRSGNCCWCYSLTYIVLNRKMRYWEVKMCNRKKKRENKVWNYKIKYGCRRLVSPLLLRGGKLVWLWWKLSISKTSDKYSLFAVWKLGLGFFFSIFLYASAPPGLDKGEE